MEYDYNILNIFKLNIPPKRLCQYASIGVGYIINLIELDAEKYTDPNISLETMKDDYATLKTFLNI
jgi:hypothetical protein